MRKSLAVAATTAVAALALALFAAPQNAGATTMVLGDGLAHSCAVSAMAGDSSDFLIDTCTLALEQEPLTSMDHARTFVNRGVVYLRRQRWDAAASDFNAAQRYAPELAEIYLNRGCLLISLRRYSDAISETDKGLALNPREPEKAYYNRALAHEMLDQMKEAYFDYRKASELKPDWADPKTQLTRFTVVQK
jgi:tetratricopeptide (TPR) repeat protein